jgi:O-methyltransferase
MPDFRKPLSGAYVDVDLASSTRTCIKYLFPLLRSGSCLMSQDGHIPLVIEIFRDQDFWRTQLGLATLPTMQGVGTSKLIIVTKP